MPHDRSLSLLFAGIAVALAAQAGGLPRGVAAATVVVLPLAAIWFPEPLARHASSWLLRGTVTRESPSGCLVALGWAVLLALPLAMLASR